MNIEISTSSPNGWYWIQAKEVSENEPEEMANFYAPMYKHDERFIDMMGDAFNLESAIPEEVNFFDSDLPNDSSSPVVLTNDSPDGWYWMTPTEESGHVIDEDQPNYTPVFKNGTRFVGFGGNVMSLADGNPEEMHFFASSMPYVS